MRIREATDEDWPAIEPFFRRIVRAGETYAYPDDLTSDEARAMWLGQARGTGRARAVVAVDGDVVLGSATMGPNRGGRGAHVATGSFMVDPAHAGRGVGRALGTHLLEWAREAGFRSVQFNAVVETNAAAVHLWQSLGLRIIGTVPEAFDPPEHGFVGLHVMFRHLQQTPHAST